MQKLYTREDAIRDLMRMSYTLEEATRLLDEPDRWKRHLIEMEVWERLQGGEK